MPLLVRIVGGALLVAHGLVHALYLAPDVREFSLDESWVVPATARRAVGVGLVVTTVAAFLLVGLAVWGVPGLSSSWPALTLVASVLSLVLLLAFWDSWLVVGLLIDVGLIALAVTRPAWIEG
jgi:hypothetical protein